MSRSNKGVFVKERHGIKWWRYDFSENGERHRGWIHPVHGMSKRSANSELKLIIADVIANKTPAGIRRQKPNTKKIIADYIKYLERYHPSTYASVKYYEGHFRYFYGKRIDEKTIESYRVSRGSEKSKRGTMTSDSTINRELQYLRAAFNQAGIKPNPFDKFQRSRESERVRYLGHDEMVALLEAASKSQNEHLSVIIETAILTGMRKMEILKLHRDKVDFNLNTIFVPSSQDKTHKNKTIPVPEQLKPAFKILATRSESGFLFENPSSRKHYTDIKNAWRGALRRAGIKDFHFHDLRHTFATYSIIVSNDLRSVQEILGHSRLTTTQKYAHVMMKQKAKLVKSTGNYLEAIIKNKGKKKR